MTTYTLANLAAFCDVEIAWADHVNQLLVIHIPDDEPDVVSYEEYQQMKATGAMIGKTVHIEYYEDLGFESVAAFNAWKFTGIPSGPEVEQFPKYKTFDTVENLHLGVDPAKWWGFKNRFAQYAAVAEKAGKKAPLIQVKHVDKADGGVNGGFVVWTIEELEKAFHYCPYDSVVSIGYYEPYAIDD